MRIWQAPPERTSGPGIARRVLCHPWLAGVFPVLSLYSANVDTVRVGELWLPLGLMLAATVGGWLGLSLLMRNRERAAIVVTAAVVCFWAYTPVYRAVSGVGPSTWLLPMLVGGLLWAVSAGTRRRPWTVPVATDLLNAVAAVAVVVALGAVIRERPWRHHRLRPGNAVAGLGEHGPLAPSRRPDIYFLVLDAFGRGDVLAQAYGIERALADGLRDLGFYVAAASSSNYGTTIHSIPSALNFGYIQDLLPAMEERPRSLDDLVGLVCGNALVRHLRGYGYKFVAYSSGYFSTECPEADEYVRPRGVLTEFQIGLLDMSPLVLVRAAAPILSPYAAHRRRIVETLRTLPRHAEDPAPTFVFAHLVTPHHPFVFGEHGEDVSPYERAFRFGGGGVNGLPTGSEPGHSLYVAAYRRQLVYVSALVQAAVREILARSPEPPVIVIQGDHGPNSHRPGYDPTERFAILNAYYLPDGGDQRLYPSISPVNSFRIVLDHYFGADLPLLPDIRYWAAYRRPFDFGPAEDGRRARPAG